MSKIEIYLVGGAVRDILLNQPIKDKDWVVIGATPEDLTKQGFKPVGKDFPVFLHPKTSEEYALARTERKTSVGYKGFTIFTSPDITLEEDLARRDLTINAMAMDQNGQLIDPYNGKYDLENKILRHISPAFAEDPVRILRVARFAARYNFEVAEETQALMQQMVQNKEVHALVAERVWQELAKGLMETTPSRMIQVLHDCGALAVILPEIAALFSVPQRADYHPEIDSGIHTLLVLNMAAKMQLGLPERFSALTHDLGKALTPPEILPRHHNHELNGLPPLQTLCQRLKVPNECADMAEIVVREHTKIHKIKELRSSSMLKLLQRVDAFRRPERFKNILNVCEADAKGRLHQENILYLQKQLWLNVLNAAQSVNAGQIAQETQDKTKIAENIYQSRLKEVRKIRERIKES